MANSRKTFSPGEATPASGQYGVLSSNGKRLQGEITSTKGNPLPPTAKSGQRYILNDPTQHKGKR